jgi:hypothetical protein
MSKLHTTHLGENANRSDKCERCKRQPRTLRQRTCFDCRIELKALAAEIVDSCPIGWVWSNHITPNDGYARSIDELREHVEDEGEALPPYVFCCTKIPYKLDAETILLDACSNHHEEIYDQLDNIEEFEQFIEKWNAEQTAYSVEADENKIIILDAAAFAELQAKGAAQ